MNKTANKFSPEKRERDVQALDRPTARHAGPPIVIAPPGAIAETGSKEALDPALFTPVFPLAPP